MQRALREVGAGEVAAVERHLLELPADELGAGEHATRRTGPACSVREPEVGVVELAVAERDVAQVRLRQLDRRRPAVDERARAATTDSEKSQPDRSQRTSSTSTRRARANASPGLAGVDDPDPDRLAVVVELEGRTTLARGRSGEFTASMLARRVSSRAMS